MRRCDWCQRTAWTEVALDVGRQGRPIAVERPRRSKGERSPQFKRGILRMPNDHQVKGVEEGAAFRHMASR